MCGVVLLAGRRALPLLRCAEVAPLLATSLPAGGGGGPRINLSKLQTASLKRYGAAYHLVRWGLLLACLLARWLLGEELVQPRQRLALRCTGMLV